MRLEPKRISTASVQAALQKAERYRLLNEPLQAESICLDVLQVDPGNREALATLLLAITDQFPAELAAGVHRAREVLARMTDEYRKSYYGGIICERYALAQMQHGVPRAGETAYEWLRDAMALYEQAEQLRPGDNDEAVLRWNTCARLIARDPTIAPATPEPYEPGFE